MNRRSERTSRAPIDTERVAQLVRQGRTTPEIADILKCCERTVDRARKRAGLSKPRVPYLTSEELARAELMLADGASAEEVGRTLGRSGRTIRDRFPDMRWTRQQVGEYAALARWAGRI